MGQSNANVRVSENGSVAAAAAAAAAAALMGHVGLCGPLWGLLGPWVKTWAHMGPHLGHIYGPILAQDGSMLGSVWIIFGTTSNEYP
jgi:hypothetical protein